MKTRLCKVRGEYGYFHTWEHYSKPLPESPFIGGEPAGVLSQVFGIVEFKDRVHRVEPTSIEFVDDNTFLAKVEKYGQKESGDGDD